MIRAKGLLLAAGLATVSMNTGSHAGIDLVNVAAGSWVHVPADDVYSGEIWFNKLSAHLYATLSETKLYVGVPLAWTVATNGDSVKTDEGAVKTDEGSIKTQQVMLGDLSFYVGRRFAVVEPRFGAKIPLGYSTDFGRRAWIGPGNVRLRAGLGLNSAVRETRTVAVSGEVMASVYLPGGVVHPGSWALEPSAKVSFRPREKLRLGLEVLGSYAYTRWGDTYLEHSILVVPNLYGELQIRNLAFGIKAGFGPSYKKIEAPETSDAWAHASYALNMAVSLNIYP